MTDGRHDALKLTVRVVGAFVVSLGVVVCLGLLLERAFTGNGSTAFDAHVTRWFLDHRTTTWTDVMRAATWLGSGSFVAPITAIVVLVLLARRRILLAVFLAVAVSGAALLGALAKDLTGRDRPPVDLRLASAGGSAFPSGHATQAAATCLALAVVVTMLTRSRELRIVVWCTAAAVIVLVGVSRVYLGVHWATDVLGGWLLAGVWVGALTLAFLPRGDGLEAA